MKQEDASKLAVLIDADNVSHIYAGQIFDEVASLGEAVVRRCYGDFSGPRLEKWEECYKTLGLAPRHQPEIANGKNSSDIALVVEAMDMLHTGRYDGFVIVSSDSDFARLASRIREQGLAVYGIGEQKAPAALRQACKKFIELEPAGAPDVDADEQIRRFVYKIIEESEDPDGWAPLVWIGLRLKRRYPDFSPRSFGHKKLSDFIQDIGGGELEERHEGEAQWSFRRGKSS